MAVNSRPWFSWFDGTADIPISTAGDNPANTEFLPIQGVNRRVITGGDTKSYAVGDLTVASRGAKNIIWSSEGYTSNLNVVVPALTANQKKATGSHVTNAGGTISTVASALDFSPYRAAHAVIVLASFTGGASPSFQPEIDFIDDAGTPNVIPLWKPSAVTSATSWWNVLGQGLVLPETPLTAAANNVAMATGFTSFAAITGWTLTSIPLPLLPNAQFQWTIANTPTAVAWTAFIYGLY